MRKIYFRAKSIDANNKGEWKFGFYRHFVCNGYDNHYIDSLGQNITTTIDVDTLGQYTNFFDKNGNEIFEGDIVTIFGMEYTIIFECGSFGLTTHDFIEYKPFKERIFEITGCNNKPRYTYNDNFMPLWEIYWNFNCEDNSIELIEIVGNIHEKKDE